MRNLSTTWNLLLPRGLSKIEGFHFDLHGEPLDGNDNPISAQMVLRALMLAREHLEANGANGAVHYEVAAGRNVPQVMNVSDGVDRSNVDGSIIGQNRNNADATKPATHGKDVIKASTTQNLQNGKEAERPGCSKNQQKTGKDSRRKTIEAKNRPTGKIKDKVPASGVLTGNSNESVDESDNRQSGKKTAMGSNNHPTREEQEKRSGTSKEDSDNPDEDLTNGKVSKGAGSKTRQAMQDNDDNSADSDATTSFSLEVGRLQVPRPISPIEEDKSDDSGEGLHSGKSSMGARSKTRQDVEHNEDKSAESDETAFLDIEIGRRQVPKPISPIEEEESDDSGEDLHNEEISKEEASTTRQDEGDNEKSAESDQTVSLEPISSVEEEKSDDSDRTRIVGEEGEKFHDGVQEHNLVPLKPSNKKMLLSYFDEKKEKNKKVREWVKEAEKRKQTNELEPHGTVKRPRLTVPVRRDLMAAFDSVEPPRPSYNPERPFAAPRTKKDKKLSDAELCPQCKPWVETRYPDPDDPARASFLRDVCKHKKNIWRPRHRDTPPNFWCTPQYSTQELYEDGHINVASSPFTPIPREKRRDSDSDYESD